jgi:hypothetical protein
MGDKFTKLTAKLRDIERNLTDINGPLLLLDHSTSDTGDYTTIATLTSGGWSLKTTREGMELVIVQSAEATPELLGRLTSVCHAEKVYKLSGTDKTRPLGSPRQWHWNVKPTGESYR